MSPKKTRGDTRLAPLLEGDEWLLFALQLNNTTLVINSRMNDFLGRLGCRWRNAAPRRGQPLHPPAPVPRFPINYWDLALGNLLPEKITFVRLAAP